MVIVARKAGGETLRRSLSWPILLTASLVGLGMVVAFVPTPSFPQYYVPPIGFGIGLVILLYAQLELGERAGVGRSEEHTSELQSLMRNSYAVFCLKKKKISHN